MCFVGTAQAGVRSVAMERLAEYDMQYVYLLEFQLLPRIASVCNECDGL